MKTLLLFAMLLSCMACQQTQRIVAQCCKRDFYAVATIDPLPVGHVIKESDLVKGRIGPAWHLDPEFTSDPSAVVGHTVIRAIPKMSFIWYQRDIR